MDINKKLSMLSIISLKESIDKLKASEKDSIAINSLCEEYSEKLKTQHDEQLCESFVVELSKLANTETSKKILTELNEWMKVNDTNIKLANCVYSMNEGVYCYAAPVVESAVAEYMLNKCDETRNELRNTVSLFENAAPVKKIMDILSYEEYSQNSGNRMINVILKEEFVGKEPEQMFTKQEVDAIVEHEISDRKLKEAEEVKKTVSNIDSHINLDGMIKNILKECKNNKLKTYCGQFMDRLNEGVAEELLYEEFISGLSNWNYLNAVDTELSALSDRVRKYKQDIDLKKILRVMEGTGSYYIVPLIEDCVVDYVDNKNMTTRAVLKQRLEAFEYDPFVRDVLNVISKDLSIQNTVYLGESVESLNKYVHTETVYSPIEYVNEDCIFNVKGTYYSRKGNSINRLEKGDVGKLSESFKSLCNLVNDSDIEFSKGENAITVYGDSDLAVISESEIKINGKNVSVEDIDNMSHVSFMTNEGKERFYSTVKTLNEHFNDIAYIDFVKRVVSNVNEGVSVDVFKLDENIYVTTTDGMSGRKVFYRNVNPIQCRNYINEHMEINVSPLFEDVLPDQENIEKMIDDKKQEYEDYIESLENKKAELEKMKDESDNVEDIDNVIKTIDKELDDTKEKYKKYQDDSEKFKKGDDDDADDSLKNEVPDDIDDIDADTDDDKNGDEKKGDDAEGDSSEPKETEKDMEEPMTSASDGEIPGEDAQTDDEFADVADFDSDFDVPVENTEITDSMNTGDAERFNVVKVSYGKNVKTGDMKSNGEVIVVIPSVDANGDVHNDMRKVSFYLDSERNIIINNEYMPLDMYTAIKTAIENCPETENVNVEGDGGANSNNVDDVEGNVPANNGADEDFNLDAILGTITNDSSTNAVVDEPAAQESPAETEKKDENPSFPVTVGVYPEEVKPVKMDAFESALDEMRIKHSQTEAADGEICINIENKAQALALFDYFKEWLNFKWDEFVNFFPEIKERLSGYTMTEGVRIKGVRMIKESKSSNRTIMLPAESVYCKAFGVNESENNSHIQLIATNKKDIEEIYEKLYLISRRGTELCEDAKDFMDAHRRECKRLCESKNTYNLEVPYNGFLEQKMKSKGVDVQVMNENMNMNIFVDDFKKAKKVLESFYGKKSPVQVKDFFAFADESLNEGLQITVKDTVSNKTIDINIDGDISVNSSAEGETNESDEKADFSSSFENSTFNIKDSLAFKDDEESADDDKEDKDKKDSDKEDKDNDENDEGKDTESTESSESESEGEEKKDDEKTEDEKGKKKFKFKVKKKSSNESVNEKHASHLNESVAKPTVLDYVKTSDGKKGQILFQLANGNFILNVDGHTLEREPGQVSMIKDRPDTVESPYKFDAATLKGLFEQMVSCGVFMNQFQVTPSDCYVKYTDYLRAKDEDEINLIIEGQNTPAQRKYVKITEDLDNVLDLGNYVMGSQVNMLGESVRPVLVNINDYNDYQNRNGEISSIRTLVFDNDTKETSLVSMPAGSVEIQ